MVHGKKRNKIKTTTLLPHTRMENILSVTQLNHVKVHKIICETDLNKKI